MLTNDGLVVTGWATVRKSSSNDAQYHEIGHNLGLHHAQGLECGANIVDAEPLLTCKVEDGRDIFSVMGAGSPNTFRPHMAAPHKERLGWISGGKIQEVVADGTYTIDNIETASPGVKFLKIPEVLPVTSGTDFYFLEYRQPVGFDVGFVNPGINYNGVLVHWNITNAPGVFTYLLDMTPGTGFANLDFWDPTLQVLFKS